MEWFQSASRRDGAALEAFCGTFPAKDAKGAEEKFNAYLRKTISIRDTATRKNAKENFYHGILLGLLGYKDSWGIYSNKESGDGYSDILISIDEEELGIIIEVKYAEDGDLEAACDKALAQIEKKHYEEQLLDAGMDKIIKYGIGCYKKRCKVMLKET